jgi:hypothetical protein
MQMIYSITILNRHDNKTCNYCMISNDDVDKNLFKIFMLLQLWNFLFAIKLSFDFLQDLNIYKSG